MRIIRQSSVEAEVTCPACTAVLAVEPADVSHRYYTDISQVSESIYEIRCAACRKRVDITDQVKGKLRNAVDTRVAATEGEGRTWTRDAWGM